MGEGAGEGVRGPPYSYSSCWWTPGFARRRYLVGKQPSLVGVLQGRRQRRHDLSTVAQVATNLGPLLELAYLLKATSSLDSLLQLVQVEGSFVDTRKSIEIGSLLLVEFGELVEVGEVRTGT